jgi:DNA recombination protein RmuC
MWILIGFIVGFTIALLWQRSRLTAELMRLEMENEDLKGNLSELSSQNEELKTENLQWQGKFNALDKEIVRLQSEKEKEIGVLKQQIQSERENFSAEIDRWRQRLDELKKQAEENEAVLEEKFQNLANKLLEETGKKLSERQAKELKHIIDPFKEQLQEFKSKVEKTDKEQFGRIKELSEQIKLLRDLNRQMTEEALNLTKALKGDSKIMGDWGEVTLKRLLELSGLEEGREYKMQQSFSQNEESRKQYRPDVIVYLPENKVLIIDAKVSVKHYADYVQADDEQKKKQLLQLHVASVRQHIKELARKNYHTLEELQGKTPEFVLMFIPLEPAFSLALKTEPTLYDEALRSQVVMVTPSTLLATLKVVESLWKTERQHQNTREIIRQASDLYDKFVGFTDDLIQLGRKLDDAKSFYEKSMNKLSTGTGNLVRRVERIRKLGLNTKKRLPESLIRRAEDDNLPLEE